MRNVELASGEYYHIFNRGVDKRLVFVGERDRARFLRGMHAFNRIAPVGSLLEYSFAGREGAQSIITQPLVHIVCYCINPNHYHFVFEQVADDGIEKFMHRLGTGYTKYFNLKYKRSGSLFQGPFKAVRISSNEYLLHVSAYVNLNMRVHRIGSLASKSSWEEYVGVGQTKGGGFCKTDVVLSQFNGADDYKKFAIRTLKSILARRSVGDELLAQTAELEA